VLKKVPKKSTFEKKKKIISPGSNSIKSEIVPWDEESNS
jgi:hypothetical protein